MNRLNKFAKGNDPTKWYFPSITEHRTNLIDRLTDEYFHFIDGVYSEELVDTLVLFFSKRISVLPTEELEAMYGE